MLCSRVLGIKQFPAWKLYSLVLGWVSGGGGVLFHSTGFDVDRLAVSMAIGFTSFLGSPGNPPDRDKTCRYCSMSGNDSELGVRYPHSRPDPYRSSYLH